MILQRASTSIVEQLEMRRLLSSVTPPAIGDLIKMDYNGQQIDARAGEWIVGLSHPAIHDAAGNVVVKHTFDTKPVEDALPGLDASQLGIQFDRYLGVDYLFSVTAPTTVSYDQLHTALGALPGFQFVEPNGVMHYASTTPNDTSFGNEDGLNNTGQLGGTSDADIDAPEAWDFTKGSTSTVVADLDSGVNYNHQDLSANKWVNPNEIAGNGIDDDGNGKADDVNGYDFVNTDHTPLDDVGHGTSTAGVIAAAGNNSTGVAGVAWTTKILPVKVGDSTGLTYANITSGIEYVNGLNDVGVNVHVINASFGGTGTDPSVETAIQDAAARNIMFVAAAGNWGDGHQTAGWNNDTTGQAIYPASYTDDNIISVAATDDNDALTNFSNYGSTSVDLAAPGGNIYTTTYDPLNPNNSSYGYVSGTSFSAPMVAGVAALAFSLKPDLTVAQVKDAILSHTDAKTSLSGKTVTGGRLNAYSTLNSINNNYTGFSATLIGDDQGGAHADDILIRPKSGDSTKTEITKFISGSYQVQYTVNNTNATKIGIFTLAGNDFVSVADGVNNRISINGGSGADSLQGGNYIDSIVGEVGNDTIYGGGAGDSIDGNGGADYIQGDALFGSSGNDTISGDSGNDTMFGNGGDDVLTGGSGNDSFSGDSGNDTLHASADGYVDSGSGGSGTDVLDIDTSGSIIDTIMQ
jgi:subtilisin family serine protease